MRTLWANLLISGSNPGISWSKASIKVTYKNAFITHYIPSAYRAYKFYNDIISSFFILFLVSIKKNLKNKRNCMRTEFGHHRSCKLLESFSWTKYNRWWGKDFISEKRYLTSKSCIYITEFKANITTSNNCYPIRHCLQFECMVTSDHSLPWR